MQALRIFWAFSRPHTIIGSIVSITTLFLLSVPSADYGRFSGILGLTLLAGLACNVFIVGLNQVIDIDLDRINKPYLPLASGQMSVQTAKRILLSSLLISVGTAFYTSVVLGWLIVLILAIGIAYSVPPIQLKKHHLPAALAITGVRGILVNAGMFLHFSSVSASALSLAWQPLWILTTFVTIFSLSIAWFKDLPDVEGDRHFHYKTAPVLYSVHAIFRLGAILLSVAYCITLLWAWQNQAWLLVYCHMAAWTFFLFLVWRTDLKSKDSIAWFYKWFWVLFFWEYIVFGVWALLR